MLAFAYDSIQMCHNLRKACARFYEAAAMRQRVFENYFSWMCAIVL